MTKKYKYNISDFGPLPVKLEHMDIYLNFLNGKVHAENTLTITAAEKLEKITLDARNLEIKQLKIAVGSEFTEAHYDYRKEQNIIIITPPSPIDEDVQFRIFASTACVPSDNILEGIYKDTTPPGCPQQYMSQCQQWGFQRISPTFDDCRAKCTMTTTLEAGAAYTHLISNGNINRKTNPGGKPVPKPGDPSRQVITYDNPVPMTPYLFIAAAGTWDVLEDEIIYPSGRKVKLEYLVPPGKVEGARIPMDILKKSVLWHNKTQEYEYRHDVYRTICMEKSNFGGMENVGNTTIITSAALIDEWIGDARLEYAHGVIIHEFEHNQCGSDVTMATPFDMWLNEAFTVDVERQFMMTQFNPDCCRLDQVDAMRAPIHGPLSIEDAGHMGNIVRKGFNDPDELVDGLTYVKAAEVIRMLKTILGQETFRKCKNTYFARYNGSNADTKQFFECFEEISGRDLSQFKKEWLFTIGYPKIEAEYSYDEGARRLECTFTQTRAGRGGLFHVPITMAAVDEKGSDIERTSRTIELTGENPLTTITFDNVPKPAFVSFNRDCSYYGTFTDRTSGPEQLIKQMKLDPNSFNRIEAARHLTDIERTRLIDDPNAGISESWLDNMSELVRNAFTPPGLKAYMLSIDEQSLNRKYLPCYRERYNARIKLLEALAEHCLDDLVSAFHAVDTYTRTDDPTEGMENRRLKAALLRIITAANTAATHRLSEEHLRKAWNISDRISALSCINQSDHPRRIELMHEIRGEWKDHLNAYTSYLGIVSSGNHNDVFDLIAREESLPPFRIEHPNHNRGLFMPMSGNNKMLWTEQGIKWMQETVIRLAPVNENTAIKLVSAFQQVNNLAADLQPRVKAALRQMLNNIDPEQCPSVAGRIKAYLD